MKTVTETIANSHESRQRIQFLSKEEKFTMLKMSV